MGRVYLDETGVGAAPREQQAGPAGPKSSYESIYGNCDRDVERLRQRTPAAVGIGSGDAIDDPLHAHAGRAAASRQAQDTVAPTGCCGGRGLQIAGTVLAGVGIAIAAVVGAAALAVGAVAVAVCSAATEPTSSRGRVIIL